MQILSIWEIYLKRVWFSNGIHHHYASDKFFPAFTPRIFQNGIENVDAQIAFGDGETVDTLLIESSGYL